MGTRCLTVILDEYRGKEIVVMYRQFDGYPDGHGQELADFLKPFKIVNGINDEVAGEAANGMSCLAAQLVIHFKTRRKDDKNPGKVEIGSIYLHPADTRNIGEEYTYTIYVDNKPESLPMIDPKPFAKCKMKIEDYNKDIIFDDYAENFDMNVIEAAMEAL